MKQFFVTFVALCFSLSASAEERIDGAVRAEILSIVDGDTIKVRAILWLDLRMDVFVRLSGLDAPELHQPHCDQEKALALEAKEAITRLLQGKSMNLIHIGYDKYAGRINAQVITESKINIGEYLIKHGLAKPWDGKSQKPEWC